jgi:hypothetical protein
MNVCPVKVSSDPPSSAASWQGWRAREKNVARYDMQVKCDP